MTAPNPGQQPDPQNPQQVVYVQAPKAPWYKRPGCLIPLVIVVLLLIGMGSCMNSVDKALNDEGITTSTGDGGESGSADGKDAAADDAPAIEVSAPEYATAYKTNEIAADSQYKGKKLIVTGTVDRIDETMGTYRVYLTGDEMFTDVDCVLEKSEVEKAATLTPGTSITVSGIGGGYDMYAHIKKCVIQ